MKILSIIGGLFSIIGLASIIGIVLSVMHTNKFLSESVLTRGEIIEVVTRTRKDSDGHSHSSRCPVIRFQDQKGSMVEFETGLSIPRQTGVGDKVDVRYLPGEPQNAVMVGSFMDTWGLSFFFAIFGVVFTALGIPVFWLGIRDSVNEKRALAYTKEIEAPVKRIFQNTSIRVNGRSPWQIEAQWLNPDTNQVHLFRSKYLWFDPAEYAREKVLIKADPGNLKKYWMDVSFLPKQA